MSWTVNFYQRGRYPTTETFSKRADACKAATEFLRDCKVHPLRQKGSVWRDNYASLVHPAFGTDATVSLVKS